jgi:hypothetical protein
MNITACYPKQYLCLRDSTYSQCLLKIYYCTESSGSVLLAYECRLVCTFYFALMLFNHSVSDYESHVVILFQIVMHLCYSAIQFSVMLLDERHSGCYAHLVSVLNLWLVYDNSSGCSKMS